MRRFLLLIMVVLLPLRGWAVDLMSVDMARSGMASAAASGMPSDCLMHMKAGAAGADTDAAGLAPAMDGCGCCALCIPLAEPATTRFDLVDIAAHAQPLMGGVDFMSVTPTPVLKPPAS